jgi:predicted nucleic acid-binding protein
MSYLLDTCVLSEFTKRQPDRKVAQWVSTADELSLYMSVISIGEIQKGIVRLPDSPRKDDLTKWLQSELMPRFGNRLLVLDTSILLAWGALTARIEAAGKQMPAIDSLIAATALHHDLILVTRNQDGFVLSQVRIVNPWL